MACPISTRMFYKRLQIVDDREMSDSEEEDTAANSEPEPSDDEFTVETEEDDEIEGDTSDHFDEVETDDIEPTDVAELPVRADVVKSRDGTGARSYHVQEGQLLITSYVLPTPEKLHKE